MQLRYAVILGAVLSARAYDARSNQVPATPTPAEKAHSQVELTPEHAQEIDDHRQIITDTGSQPESRRRMAERMLALDNPARIDLAVELLSSADAAVAVCEAITSVGTKRPQLLDARLVEPLVALLGHEDAALSHKAAAALSAFPDDAVAGRLGDLASDGDRPLRQRLAAISALALSTDRRDIVAELIGLTASSDPAVVARAVDALRPASRLDYADDLVAWRKWWTEKQKLDDAEWLRYRLDLAVQHNQSLLREVARLRADAESRSQYAARRTCELLRTNLQLTQANQRDAKLEELLTHTKTEDRLCALSLVGERIREGEKTSDAIRDAVKGCFGDALPEVRTDALQVIENLKDPQDAPEVLMLLTTENVLSVRETILRVLGRLKNPVAITALVSELSSPTAPVGCVREAAIAVGALCDQAAVAPAVIDQAITPLRDRLAAAAPTDLRLKEALLGAMARIGDPAFAADFAEYLSAESPELVVASIRGVEVVGDTDQIDRLLGHLGHSDARVRRRAVAAVGSLGTAPEHLAALFGRWDPNVEPNEGVRNVAWDAFRAVLTKNPTSHTQWVDRLGPFPDLQITLLSDWVDARTGNNGSTPEVDAARDKLAHLLLKHGKFVDAMTQFQKLRKAYAARNDPRAADVGIDWVNAHLRSGRHESIGETLNEVCNGDAAQKTAVADTLISYLEDALQQQGRATLSPLLDQLQAIPIDTLGPDWPTRLAEVRTLAATPSEGDAEPSPE